MQGKERRKFIAEELVDKYFREQENQPGDPGAGSSGEGAFEKEKVFRNILAAIRGRKRPLQIFTLKWRVAASLSILLCISIAGYHYRRHLLNYIYPHRTMVKEAALGEIALITLSDGTKIWLNAGSRLTYPGIFKENSREVSLDGEAYFDVAHNAGAPFLVHAGQVTTRVLGTRFNISAYPEDRDIAVSVDQGKVSVSIVEDKPAGDALVVRPRQRAVYNKASKVLVRDEAAVRGDPASWKEGKLVYRNTPLPEIIDDIQRTYNVKITTGKDIRNCTISADFNRDSLVKVLRVLAELVNGEITGQDGQYILSGAGCREPL